MKTPTIAIVCVFAVCGAAATAYAEIPTTCASPYNSRGYVKGIASGESLAEQAWSTVNDVPGGGCDQLEYFIDIIVDDITRLTLRPTSSDYVICRYTGMVDGVYNKLDEIWSYCEINCADEGVQVGEFAAEIYCDLSIALGGLDEADQYIRGPVQICGLEFETACDFQYIETSGEYLDGQCVPYTEGDYFEVWDQTRINQCRYEEDDDDDLTFEDDGED
jgi:hypothetical protein